MQKLLALLTVFMLLLASCGSKGKEKTDTSQGICKADCLKDTIKYGEDGKGKAYVYITTKNCGIDSVFWGTHGMGTVRSAEFPLPEFKVSENRIRCLINGGNYAYLLLNDCETRKGVVLKMLLDELPEGKKQDFMITSKAINNGNPKFSIADNLVVVCDGGNLLIEDANSGKEATFTFGKKISDIDYNFIHEYIDSVNITITKGWAKVKLDGSWQVVQKDLDFK